MAVMNRFGLMAKDHWARWLPTRYAELVATGQVETFFTDLGEQAAARVTALVDSMSSMTPKPAEPGEPDRRAGGHSASAGGDRPGAGDGDRVG